MTKNEKLALIMALECILDCMRPIPLSDSINYWEKREKYIKSTIKCIKETIK